MFIVTCYIRGIKIRMQEDSYYFSSVWHVILNGKIQNISVIGFSSLGKYVSSQARRVS